MGILKKFNKDFFLYGGITEEEYKRIEDQRSLTNFRVWGSVSRVCTIYFMILFAISLFGEAVSNNRKIYIFMAIISVLSSLIFRKRETMKSSYVSATVYIMIASLLFFSIYIGAIVSTEYLAVTFPVLLIAIPLFTVERPYRTSLINLGATLLFTILVIINKRGNTRIMDIYNGFGFLILSQIICFYTAKTKMQSALMMNRIEGYSLQDDLTGFNNRRSFEDDCKTISNGTIPEDLVIVSLDVNGLKTVNDSLGHEAGDELICGAADCMKSCLGGYGRIYRTGGDEFMAILNIDEERLKLLLTNFENITERWEGNFVKGVSVSYGYVMASEAAEETIQDMIKLSDKRMYDAKAAYYSKKGVDRRGQRDAFNALCASYVKILKVNLTDDTYSTVSARPEVEAAERNFSKDSISQYIRDVARGGAIHPDDVNKLLDISSIEYVKQYFMEHEDTLNVYYKRQIDGEYRQSIMQIIPASNFTPEAMHAFLYVKDIGKR